MIEINVDLGSEEKKMKGDMIAILEYLKCLLWSRGQTHSLQLPRAKLGQIERRYANVWETHRKLELKQVLWCLSPLRLSSLTSHTCLLLFYAVTDDKLGKLFQLWCNNKIMYLV